MLDVQFSTPIARYVASEALIVSVLLLGCEGSSSPTAPVMPGAGLTIHFTDSGGALDSQHELIRRLIQDAYDSASQRIFVDDVTVFVAPGPQRVVPGWGVGGFARDSRTVDIAIDAGQPDQLLVDRLPSMAVHEFHHVARYRGPGYGSTLLEAMVSEGLADHFAQELLAESLPPWVTALSESEIPEWIDRARPEFDSTGYNHSSWFFGAGVIPRWTGYSVGFHLVSEYQTANGSPSAAELVHADADLFRPR